MHLFVFPNAMPRRGEERIKLNIEGTVFHFFHDEEEVIIETALLRDGSSTMVLNNTITGKTYALYNFREILEVLDMTPKEMLRTLSQRGFMQIDKCGGELYVKVFLPEGEAELLSDTTNFSDFWTRPLYISHAGQTQELTEGKNEVTFTYIPTEAAYVGNPNCRYKGRAIDLEKVVGGMR